LLAEINDANRVKEIFPSTICPGELVFVFTCSSK